MTYECFTICLEWRAQSHRPMFTYMVLFNLILLLFLFSTEPEIQEKSGHNERTQFLLFMTLKKARFWGAANAKWAIEKCYTFESRRWSGRASENLDCVIIRSFLGRNHKNHLFLRLHQQIWSQHLRLPGACHDRLHRPQPRSIRWLRVHTHLACCYDPLK